MADDLQLLTEPDEQVRTRAAAAWMAWEDAHVSLSPYHSPGRYDPAWRQVFTTLVVHYWKNAAFLPPTALRDGMPVLQGIPGVLIRASWT